MMNKFELNDKLARLYNITEFYYPIDEWDIIISLAVDNKLSIHVNKNDVLCTYEGDVISDEFFDDYESPQAATRFAIAMALVKLKEDK